VRSAKREASLETKESSPVRRLMERIAQLVEKYGFPSNPRENLTVLSRNKHLRLSTGGKLVDQVMGKDGPKRELYNHFFTPKGYSADSARLQPYATFCRSLSAVAELIKNGETLDPETGIPVKADTDQSIKTDRGESRLLTEEKTREEAAYFGRTQAGSKANKKTTMRFDNRPLTDAEREEIKRYVDKTLGPDIKVEFERDLGVSGEWDPTKDTIHIAVMSGVNGMSVANHEALHAFFSTLGRFGKADVRETLQTAANSTAVRRQLERLLTSEPAARRQLDDPEERAAYMYQFWVAAKAGKVEFRVGPETDSVLGQIAAFFRKVMGIVTTDEKAEAILQAFHDGQMKTPGAVEQVVQQHQVLAKQSSLKTMLGNGFRKAQQFTQPAYDFMASSDNSEITKIADLFYRDSVSDKEGQGFINARSQQGSLWLNKFSTVLEGISKEDLETSRDILQGKHDNAPNKKVADTVALTRGMLREFYNYMKDAGVNVQFRKNYFPRTWDMEKITLDASGFKDKLLQNHRGELEKLGDAAFQKAMEAHRHALSMKWNSVAPDHATYTAEATADHIIATLSAQNGVVADDVADDPAKKKLSERMTRPGFTPFMQAVNARTLTFLDMSVFGEYLKDDMANIMSTYLLNGVRRAEYARRFGNDGEGLATMMDRALAEETQRVKTEVDGGEAERSVEVQRRYAAWTKAIMAMEGTLGYDITPTMRRINSGLMVYQNLRILPLSIFSSLIDPLGITIRSGSIKDAYDTFVRGVKELGKNFAGKGKTEDGAAKLAELLGTVDNKYMLDALGQTYQSVYLYGWAKKLNEQLFKWNGMEAWNRAMRVGATQTAIKFIGEHAQGVSEHSERWLAELGLKASDVQTHPDGTVKALAEEGLTDAQAAKMRIAVQRFVDSAVLRPSAAQRPAWASDPHYALFFHLKQFTYSFQQVILRRAWHEFQHGNLTPAMVLLSYVPLMLAADIAKGIIQGGGSEPEWKKGWTVGDYTVNAVQRAGLLGVGQFAWTPSTPESPLSAAPR
jgi:hypothetical protein